MSDEDAIEILSAHFEGRYDSMYLHDAWEHIKEKLTNQEDQNGIIRTKRVQT